MRVKRQKRQRQKRLPPSAPVEEDLQAMSGAIFGFGEERQPEVQAPDRDSIEDPLQDWPESSGEPDQWLKERRGRGDEQGKG